MTMRPYQRIRDRPRNVRPSDLRLADDWRCGDQVGLAGFLGVDDDPAGQQTDGDENVEVIFHGFIFIRFWHSCFFSGDSMRFCRARNNQQGDGSFLGRQPISIAEEGHGFQRIYWTFWPAFDSFTGGEASKRLASDSYSLVAIRG
jgi:hypothetical protein